MLKKILMVIMLSSTILTAFNTVSAGLLDDIIQQGSDFSDSTSSAEREEYERLSAEINAEYNAEVETVKNKYKYYLDKYKNKNDWWSRYMYNTYNNRQDKEISNLTKKRNDKLAAAGSMGSTIGGFIETEVKDVIWGVGNLIFAGITVILGAKYIWSSAEGKAQVMESLPTFVLAVIFFYLAEPLFDFVMGTADGFAGASDWDELSGNVIWIINTVVKYLALGGLIFMGVRYLLASAEGKASLKTSMGGMVIGVLFVFLGSNVVDFIISFGNDIL